MTTELIDSSNDLEKRVTVLEKKTDTQIHEQDLRWIEQRLDNLFNLLTNTNAQVSDILVEQGRQTERMKNKTLQNGKQDEKIADLEREDSTLKEDMAIVKTEISSLKDLMKQIITFLKAIAVSIGVAAFFFIIKTYFGI